MPSLYYGKQLTYNELIQYIKYNILDEYLTVWDDDNEIDMNEKNITMDWFENIYFSQNIFRQIENIPDKYKIYIDKIIDFLTNKTHMKCIIQNQYNEPDIYIVGILMCDFVYGYGERYIFDRYDDFYIRKYLGFIDSHAKYYLIE